MASSSRALVLAAVAVLAAAAAVSGAEVSIDKGVQQPIFDVKKAASLPLTRAQQALAREQKAAAAELLAVKADAKKRDVAAAEFAAAEQKRDGARMVESRRSMAGASFSRSATLAAKDAAAERRRACPTGSNGQECSGQGSCSSGSCTCNAGYTGVDCGVRETALTSGVTLSSQRVTTFGWQYYWIQIPFTGTGLLVDVNQTTVVGDADVYVQQGALPSRSQYLARNIDVTQNSRITIQSVPRAGKYYIGVYGFVGVTFNIRATLTGTCPNQCSGHGTCTNGDCSCNSGWSGDDCSRTLQLVPFGRTVGSQAVRAGEWATYAVDVPQVSASTTRLMTLSMQETSGASSDCDMYVRHSQEPTLFLWDYANVTTNQNTEVVIQDPAASYWYIGVYGFTPCSFSFTPTLTTQSNTCQNECSGRGTCSGGTCACPTTYSGSTCETLKRPMVPTFVYEGFVEDNAWNYYTYQANTANNLVITVNQRTTPPAADCDLFVKQGARPTRTQYDFQDVGIESSFTLVVPDAGSSLWHIGMFGWASCNYTISATETTTCPNGCSGHGTCEASGDCVCSANYAGDDCSKAAPNLASNTPASGSTTFNTWSYHTINVVNASALHVQVKETSTQGFLWVYIAKGNGPTLRSYMFADTATNDNVHRIGAEAPAFGPLFDGKYVIGVYGNPFAPTDATSIDYKVIAWAPSFA